MLVFGSVVPELKEEFEAQLSEKVKYIGWKKSSDIYSELSVADIVAVLYTDVMNYDINQPKWDGRDRFVLSKGHAGLSLYTTLAETGFFDKAELNTYYQNGSRLSGHVSHYVPGVEFSTGSLGHGLSVGIGMAYALKKKHNPAKVYAILGDGEWL